MRTELDQRQTMVDIKPIDSSRIMKLDQHPCLATPSVPMHVLDPLFVELGREFATDVLTACHDDGVPATIQGGPIVFTVAERAGIAIDRRAIAAEISLRRAAAPLDVGVSGLIRSVPFPISGSVDIKIQASTEYLDDLGDQLRKKFSPHFASFQSPIPRRTNPVQAMAYEHYRPQNEITIVQSVAERKPDISFVALANILRQVACPMQETVTAQVLRDNPFYPWRVYEDIRRGVFVTAINAQTESTDRSRSDRSWNVELAGTPVFCNNEWIIALPERPQTMSLSGQNAAYYEEKVIKERDSTSMRTFTEASLRGVRHALTLAVFPDEESAALSRNLFTEIGKTWNGASGLDVEGQRTHIELELDVIEAIGCQTKQNVPELLGELGLNHVVLMDHGRLRLNG